MKDILFDPPTDFAFQPADFVPFKDRALCERLRKLSGKDLEKHPNPAGQWGLVRGERPPAGRGA